MAAAADAMILRARHQESEVLLGADVAWNRRVEAGPAGAAVELHLRGEQRKLAPRADERPFALLVIQRARAGRLGRFLSQDGELLGCEDLAPLLLGMADRLDARRQLVLCPAAPSSEQERGERAHDESPSSHLHGRAPVSLRTNGRS